MEIGFSFEVGRSMFNVRRSFSMKMEFIAIEYELEYDLRRG
jgi:hypothetical protein